MIGSQEPRIRVEPERKSTDGKDASLLMQEYGYSLDRWQQDIIDCWLGKDKADNYTVTSAGLALPRQNGKNVCLEAREFFGMVINGEKILHTAHQVRTSKKSFRRLSGIFTDKRHPEIEETIKNIRFTNGEECIELVNGGSIEFSARSRQAARGFDGISLVVFDEAQELTEDQIEAIMATLSASPTGTRQLIYTGTPPYPGCPGTVFRRRRDVCLKDPGKHDAWHEWSVVGDTINDIKIDDRSLWYMTNPAMGIRLTEEFTEEEFRSMSPDGFARERLGWWSPQMETVDLPAIDPEKWKACASGKAKPKGKTAFGVRFSPDGAEVCLAGAVIGEKETRIELIARRSMSEGVQWLADWLAPRSKEACCVVIDGRNGVDVLIDRISDSWKYKGSKLKANTRDVIAATGMLTNAVIEGSLSWYKKQSDLNDSALTSVKRPIGQQGWGFGGENATPIEAVALALYGARTSKRNPQKRMRIG